MSHTALIHLSSTEKRNIMNRSTFVKSILAMTGTAFIHACKDAENLAITPDQAVSPIPDLEYSRQWFSDTYMHQFTNASARVAEASVHRTADWSNSVQVKMGKENFIWIPVKYDNQNTFPRLVTWKEGQEYIPKLAEYLAWFIAEGFIVYRDSKGDYQGFLAQVAYDPFKHKPGKVIDSKHFTGMVVHAAWNEAPLRVWRFLDGSLESSFDSDRAKQGRMQQCNTTYYSYQTVTGQSCGPNCWNAIYTLHNGSYTICDNGSGGSGGGSQGYPYYGGGGSGGYTTPPTSGGPTPFIGYDFYKIAAADGSFDYQIFMQRLNTFLTTANIPATTFGVSATYADTMCKALGIENAIVVGTTTLSAASKTIGVAGVALGSVQLVIALSDGNISQTDLWNAGGLVLGAISVFTPIGWIGWGGVLATGVLSAAIGFYTAGK